MLALASPIDTTERVMVAETAPPTGDSAPMCFLSILAEASIEHTNSAKRARTQGGALPGSPVNILKCAENALESSEICALATECSEVADASECTTRCPSPTSFKIHRSRSTSPNSGKLYVCNRCARGYASTDAVRKHARQNHPEWLKERGLGCPSLYCTAVEATGAPTEFHKEAVKPTVAVAKPLVAPSAVPVAAVPVPAFTTASPFKPPIMAVAAPNPNPVMQPRLAVMVPAESTPAAPAVAPVAPVVPPSPADPAAALLLMTAAESCHTNSFSSVHDEEEEDDDDERDEQFAAFLAARAQEMWSAPMAHAPVQRGAPAGARKPRAGNKRPRTVRCGNCDGCMRAECGQCKNCVDMPRFGGPGARKQGCVRKICAHPRVAA